MNLEPQIKKIGRAFFFAVNILSGGMRVKQSIYLNIINIVLSLPNSKNRPQEVFRV